jgi:hypothetical protein
MSPNRTALWQAVKQAQPTLSDHEVDALLTRAAQQERDLVLTKKIPIDQAREIVRQELFPNVDPWQGDEQYGPPR